MQVYAPKKIPQMRIGVAKNAVNQLQGIWKDRNISIKNKRKLNVFSCVLHFLIQREDVDSEEGRPLDCGAGENCSEFHEQHIAPMSQSSKNSTLPLSARIFTTCLGRICEYFGHIARKIVTVKLMGKRPRGHRHMRWSD